MLGSAVLHPYPCGPGAGNLHLVSMMEFWTKIDAIAAVGQLVVLFATAWFVWRYLQETTELRRIAQQQLEAQIRPALTLVSIGGVLYVSNVGSGAGLNLRLVKTKAEAVDWKAKTNFGAGATGAAVAVGEPVNTFIATGSYGSINSERLHLIYESLSGNAYASIITFEGNGQPSGVRFLINE
jgi:hypothetical protein